MTIFILSNDPRETSTYLDDITLDKVIRNVAQVLCDVHHYDREPYTPHCAKVCGDCVHSECILRRFVPMPYKETKDLFKWVIWAIECKANYLYLVELLDSCLSEHNFRFNKDEDNVFKKHIFFKKFNKLFLWTRDNIPDLPEGDIVLDSSISTLSRPKSLALIMPKKYQRLLPDQNPIEFYRNFYQAKLKQFHNFCLVGCTDRVKNMPFQKCPRIKWTNRKKPEWVKL